MSVETLFLVFNVALVALFAVSFTMGKKKATSVREGGVKMHSQPDQYGFLLGLFAVIPAILFSLLCVMLNITKVTQLSPMVYSAAALAIGALGAFVGLGWVRPKVEARNKVENFIKYLLILASSISVLTTFGILISIIFESLIFFGRESFWYFITGTEWATGAAFLEGAGRAGEGGGDAKFGAVSLFAGTFMMTAIALAVALPIGIMSAVFMSEYASSNLRGKVKPILEILAGIPTVVYGFFAAITVAPFIVKIAEFFGLEASFNNALSSGLVMGIMVIPIIASLSDDVISAVPNSMRMGSLAMGITKAETIRFVVLPAAMPGIIAATLLGISRAVGETMIVVMAAGLRPNLTWNPLEDMTTVTVRIVDALTGDQAFDSSETLAAFALGLTLFVITLVLNTVSVITIKKFKEKYKMSNL